MKQEPVRHEDQRVQELAGLPVSREALAAFLVEYRDALDAWREQVSCEDCTACAVLEATLPEME